MRSRSNGLAPGRDADLGDRRLRTDDLGHRRVRVRRKAAELGRVRPAAPRNATRSGLKFMPGTLVRSFKISPLSLSVPMVRPSAGEAATRSCSPIPLAMASSSMLAVAWRWVPTIGPSARELVLAAAGQAAGDDRDRLSSVKPLSPGE
jgi:hypothetical protein